MAVYYNWAGYITEKFEVVLRLRRIFCAEYGLVKVKERLLVFYAVIDRTYGFIYCIFVLRLGHKVFN